MRDLASIVTVETKTKMFEKDRICCVTFNELGYEAIVPIDVNIGDKMVFIQEGSILPEIERWEFLRKRCYMESVKGFVIKPMVMGAKDDNGEKGERVKSWGLCVTLSEAGLDESLVAGSDVTESLGILKYEPNIEDASPTKTNNGKLPKFIKWCLEHKLFRWIGNKYLTKHKATQSNFPSNIIEKSDEQTIQNCKSVIKQFPGTFAIVTAKMEGQSFTCGLDPKTKEFYICSRNNRYDKKCGAAKDFFTAAEMYDIERKLRVYYKKTKTILVLQGEQCGPGIQGNIYNLEHLTWFLFRAKMYKDGEWTAAPNYATLEAVADDFGIDVVPLVEEIDDIGVKFGVKSWTEKDENDVEVVKYNSAEVIDNLVKYAENLYWTPNNLLYTPKNNEKLWKNYLQHEGMVIKSYAYDKERGIGFSFKVKNCAYAEKQYSEMNKIAGGLK